MAIPPFQDIMLPALKLAADGKEHSKKEFLETLANQFNLTPVEREELLESGSQGRFDNRTAWAISYLRNALLVESTGRGRFKITARGFEALKAPPPRIDIAFLMRYEEFREFRTPTKKETKPVAESEEVIPVQTPTEAMDAAYKQLRQALAGDLLQRIKSCSPKFFETLVVDVLLAMGYGGSKKDSGKVVGRSGDGGIDGVIKEDKLGLDMIYVQAKRWEGTVGRPTVQGFAGSLDGHRARKGILITTSSFSEDALDYADRIDKKIVLIDGEALTQLMIDHRVGVTATMEYILSKVDADYFEEEA